VGLMQAGQPHRERAPQTDNGSRPNHSRSYSAAGCESLRAIAAGLEELGIPAARGGNWSAVYCGWRPFRRKRRPRHRVKRVTNPPGLYQTGRPWRSECSPDRVDVMLPNKDEPRSSHTLVVRARGLTNPSSPACCSAALPGVAPRQH
jgi:hypothetical protein